MADTYLQIPSRFKGWFGRPVVITRGIGKSVYLYHPKYFRDLNAEMAEKLYASGKDRSSCKEFLDASSTRRWINREGELMLPQYLIKYLGRPIAFEVEEEPGQLTIKTLA